MLIRRIMGATRFLGAPPNWNPETDGHCGTLPVLDTQDDKGNRWMISAWEPTPEEIAALAAGAPIYLHIAGVAHPVVGMSVGEPNEA